jgi:antitoxin component YwqK of YwqJK toxin-antitoxin module
MSSRKVTELLKNNNGYAVYYLNEKGLREGLYISYHNNGTKYEECEYKNGKKNGKYILWYPPILKDSKIEHPYTQIIQIECFYKNNKLEGKYTSNRISGVKWEEGNYKNGLLDGTYILFDNNGNRWMRYEYKDGVQIDVLYISSLGGLENHILNEGIITVWKVCTVVGKLVYVQLLVPADALRVTPDISLDSYRFKSRVNKAKVVEITDKDGKHYTECESCVYSDCKIKYILNEMVYADSFTSDPNIECGHGIHVFKFKKHCEQVFLRP